MVMEFFRKGDPGIDAIGRQIVSMLGEARHSFDLATDAVLSGVDPANIADDVRATDSRINAAEQELRSELVVHVSVQGTRDIATVLGYTLLIKKIERIGDQAKNILDLAEEGVSFAQADDLPELLEQRRTISSLFAETAELLGDPEPIRVREFRDRADALRRAHEAKVRGYMHSDEPGHQVVPRAILYRYWKRIVANLGGIITAVSEPLHHQDYYDEGTTDINDD